MEKPRFRRFCLTWNNFKEDSLSTIANTGHSYIIVGKEKGEGGTPHYQIYVEYKNPITFSAVCKRFNKKAHVEVAEGDADANIKYCSKENMIFSEGVPFKQGARNDLKDIRINIEKGKNIREMAINEDIINYQGLRMAEGLMKYFEPKRMDPPTIIWRYGETGAGKSKWVYDKFGTEVFTPTSFKWWEGYDGHKVVLIDDIRDDWCKFHEFIKLTDRYPYRVECKNGSRQLLATTIVITSPYHPRECWETWEDKDQLVRRIEESPGGTITKVIKLTKRKKAQKSRG